MQIAEPRSVMSITTIKVFDSVRVIGLCCRRIEMYVDVHNSDKYPRPIIRIRPSTKYQHRLYWQFGSLDLNVTTNERFLRHGAAAIAKQ